MTVAVSFAMQTIDQKHATLKEEGGWWLKSVFILKCCPNVFGQDRSHFMQFLGHTLRKGGVDLKHADLTVKILLKRVCIAY